MLKITNDDNQLTDKVNKILNNDAENNTKNILFNAGALYDDFSKLCSTLNSLFEKSSLFIEPVDNNKKFFDYLSKRDVKNKYTFVINDKCGEDWVYDLINTCALISQFRITYYSISDILKMPYDVACEKLGDINLSEYEDYDTISNNRGYIEKLKHITNCKFVLTYIDYRMEKPPSVFFDSRFKFTDLDISEKGERTEKLNEFKKVYGSMSHLARGVLFDYILFDKKDDGNYPSDEDIEDFWGSL